MQARPAISLRREYFADISYWLTSKVGDRYAQRNPLVFTHVHLAYSSMCSISPRIHSRLLNGGIDVKGHFDRKRFYSRTEWTRRLIRSSSTVLLVVRSRSVSVWLEFGPTHPTISFVALFGWSPLRWRKPFSIAISSYIFAPTICRISWMVWAPRCPTVYCCWNLRYSGSIDGELPFSRKQHKLIKKKLR